MLSYLVMGFRVMTRRGVPIDCATPEEAMRMADALAEQAAQEERRSRRGGKSNGPTEAGVAGTSSPTSNGSSGVPGTGGWTPPAKLASYVRSLNPKQQSAIRLIATASPNIQIAALTSALGLPARRDTSILLAACSRMAKKAGFAWEDVVNVTLSGARSERTAYYNAGPLLRGEATTR